ncbi:MAG TPA: 6-carboxytetrahydropterin synthase QueD [Dehalococcoidia bacterium]|jgi:6-pyruvoyltetrahydropterin/6-carboxytetrahydropterin synthase|nr:6-carboxytetrahydropterin synthase QueD [Dehalococcoidia bacterium]
MYQVSVEQHFDAAHYLRGYKGKCETVHGHRFKVVVTVSRQGLDQIDLAYDFVELKGKLKQILDRFDHSLLNEVPPFDKINASSENIASTIYKELAEKLRGEPVRLAAVEVWESPENRVTYSP